MLDYSDRETEREEYSLLTSDDLHVVVYAYNAGVSHYLQFCTEAFSQYINIIWFKCRSQVSDRLKFTSSLCKDFISAL